MPTRKFKKNQCMNSDTLQEICFYSQTDLFHLDREDSIQRFLHDILIQEYGKTEFLINYIFVSKKEISEMNVKYLQHNYPTDVITFDFSDDYQVFGGDIFICHEIVQENAITYNEQFETELLRVICHGLLHLLGFNDKTKKEIAEMREKEEICLEYYRSRINS